MLAAAHALLRSACVIEALTAPQSEKIKREQKGGERTERASDVVEKIQQTLKISPEAYYFHFCLIMHFL